MSNVETPLVFRCNICGNEVFVIKVGDGELFCCGQPMEKIEG
ncbi:MAG: desulfoferrodoxin FeS4 iron-binding domain-containing protein [Candidatus Atribacteria bacterium]